jgi:hypothetical protein
MKTANRHRATARTFGSHSPFSSLEELIGTLKRTMKRRLTHKYGSHLRLALIRRAMDDAEDLARSTDFPQLFFPVLAEEKVRMVSSFLAPSPAHRHSHSFLSAA